MEPGEIRLAWGLICVVLGAALAQFVIIGLAGLALLLAAFVVLLRAGFLLATDHHPSLTLRHIAGLVLYAVGVILLIGIACHECVQAHGQTLLMQRGSDATPDFPWPALAARSAAVTATITAGLAMATAMSWRRLLIWALLTGTVSAAAVLLFRLLATSQPITA